MIQKKKELTVSGSGRVCGTYFAGGDHPWGGFNSEILSIRVLDGITDIPSFTFEYCSAADSIVLPESLTRLDMNAFNDCETLNNLILPSSLEVIGYVYFNRCYSLTDIYYFGTEEEWLSIDGADQVKRYDGTAEIHFLELIPATATCDHPGIQAHYRYDDTSVYSTLYDLQKNPVYQLSTVPALGHSKVIDEAISATCTEDGLTEGSHCSVCKKVIVAQQVIPAGHTVEDDICIKCESYGTCGENLTWEFDETSGTLTISGTGAMYDYIAEENIAPWRQTDAWKNDQITKLSVGAKVTTIGDYAFYQAEKLETVQFQKDSDETALHSIGECAFTACYSLEEIVIPNSVLAFGYAAFASSGLKEITLPDGITQIANNLLNGCNNLKTYTIPNTVTTIGNYAFSASGLESIAIPDSVTSIGDDAFDCDDLTRVDITDIEAWCKIEFATPASNPLCNFSKDSKLYLNGQEVNDLIIPDTVTEIKDFTFYDCASLKSVTIPATLTKIGGSVFEECRNISKVYICDLSSWFAIDFGPNGNPLCYGASMYLNDSKVDILTIPDDITNINRLALAGSTFEEVVIHENVISMGSYAFRLANVSSIKFLGDAPSFEFNSFDQCTTTAYYPDNNDTWTEEVMQNYGGTITWVPYGAVENRLVLDSAEFGNYATVWIDGVEMVIQKNGDSWFIDLPDGNARVMSAYTYHEDTSAEDGVDAHRRYPVSMRVWTLENQNGVYTATRQDVFDNILQYSGISIRITGKQGIRMITSIEKDKKNALISDGLAGYTLKEYGTVVAWASQLTNGNPLVLGQSYAMSNYAYKKGVADPVFAYNGNLMQYTNVLVGFSLDQCKNDLAMRPYMILTDAEGNEITLYGGIVQRSIGYIAAQNADTFDPVTETSAYNYIRDIIYHVYGEDYVPEAA